MCTGDHALFMCEAFRNLTPEKRHAYVVKQNLCFNCFGNNHSSRYCYKPSKCNIQGCQRKHSRLIHLLVKPDSERKHTYPQSSEMEQTYLKGTESSSSDSRDKPIKAASSACNIGSTVSSVALPIVRVQVSAKSNERRVWTYALLDSGSTNSFCSNQLLDELGIEGWETALSLTTLEKKNSQTRSRVGALWITDAGNRTTISMPIVFGTSNLNFCNSETDRHQIVDEWSHLKDLKFPLVDRVKVGIIIGQDVPVALTPIDVRKGKDNEPYAVKTSLGWVLNGPLTHGTCCEVVSNFVHMDTGLDAQVERMWKMDICESYPEAEMSQEDKTTIKIWDESLEIVEGHYQMRIPFKNQPPSLENNYSVAESRLESLGKRLAKDDKLLVKYEAGIQDLLEKGFAEKVSEEDINRLGKGVWYIPHHAVVNEHKPDKLRIVFDCAAKFCGTSLNEQVYQGPDLTNKLIGVLLRFREGPIGIMGDIEGMFHQVKVPECDRDYLRFLWFPKSGCDQPQVYRMTVHLFGGVWSPSCASYALRRSAEDNRLLFEPDVVQTVLDNFYVDDCLKALMEDKEAIHHIQQLCELVSHGGFKLHKWMCNNREVLQSIPEEKRAKSINGVDLSGESLPTERALGVLWDTEQDELGFRIKIRDKPCTRRGLMSVIASIYDPLGFVSPFILQAKNIFQEESRRTKHWDEKLSEANMFRWKKWISDLPLIEHFSLPRSVVPSSENVIYELHNFSDASSTGYGAVSYLKVIGCVGQSYCELLFSKSRLAPLKQMTIPRLELSAAVVSVKLDRMIRKELKLKISRSVFWTDSTVVLQYIKNVNRRFHVFVANRITLIHETSDPSQWRHVCSSDNPADDVSRGLDANQMVSSDRWKHGPQFLSKPESEWPRQITVGSDISEDDKEIKRDAKNFTATTDTDVDTLEALFERYSNWYCLKQAVGWILRLKKILHDKIKGTGSTKYERLLTVNELQDAEIAIVQAVQRKYYDAELKLLKSGKAVSSASSLYRLEPTLTSKGVLCIGGRLNAAPISETRKHNMIVPRESHVSTLIIRHFHEVSGHSGKEYVLSLIRQRFWIPKGRKSLGKVINSCVKCRKHQQLPGKQRMADLPPDRVTPGDPPFTNVGLDCFGPFIVKRGRSEIKRYGCIFTCLATRAVHLEKLDGLDTDSFLNGFVRFISRRGCPKQLRSDNGTNFHGADAELSKAFKDWNTTQVEKFMTKKEISWVFNPPAASHMGGVWERLIRSVRKVMNALLKTSRPLDDDGLNTLFCEIESIVNGRPITIISDDHRDAEPLTPNHLLLLRAGPSLPLGNLSTAEAYRRRWKNVQLLADSFWKRWTREYLPTLQQRQKWIVPKRNISVGDIVLLVNETTPRRQWPIGKVIDTYPGSDGLVRSAVVRTGSSTLTRPIDKLCLLEGILAE